MKDCCADPANRVEGFGPRGPWGLEIAQERDDLAVTHCKECDCRHVEGEADTGEFGVAGAPLG